MKLTCRHTLAACFIGCMVQAILNNFLPLLFLTFQGTYGIPLSQITALVTVNFAVQLLVDMLSIGFVDKIGYRASMLIAHVCAALGFLGLVVLPEVMPCPFAGLLISVIVYAVGGGLLEVVVTPLVEACPTDNKEKAMSLLHSFYCWGHVAVVLFSTVFFSLFGIRNWKILALIWMLMPIANTFLFAKTPIVPLIAEGERGMSLKELFSRRIFWILLLMMVCAGAAEQAVSQWASTLAEKGLGVSKTLGDLAGPMTFAIAMGCSRAFYGKFGDRLDLDKFMAGSIFLCVLSYLMIALVPNPAVNLIGCSVCGLAVGILWPGTVCKAAAAMPLGGTTMFALLALGGDLGCSGGPAFAGMAAAALGEDIQKGVLCAVVFPLLLLLLLPMLKKARR